MRFGKKIRFSLCCVHSVLKLSACEYEWEMMLMSSHWSSQSMLVP